MLRHIAATLLALSLLASPSAPAAEPGPSLAELREMQQRLEGRHQRELDSLNAGIASREIDPDAASEKRFRIEQSYRRDMDSLMRAQEDAYSALDAQARAKDAAAQRSSRSSPGGASRTGPRLPPSTVIEYSGDGGSSHFVPERDGRQKNIGIGVRELEF